MADGHSAQRRVLVVDDDPKIGRFLKRYLEREGLRVDVALGGEQMRESMCTERTDLVILDLNMPGDDGLTLTRELLARIRSVLRRAAVSSSDAAKALASDVRFSDFCLSVSGRELRHEIQGTVPLTTLEFDLLALLVRNAHRVMSRAQLLEQAAGRQLTARLILQS